MLTFLFKLLHWARPYRLRLALGVVLSIMAGVNEALLVAAVSFVFAVVFPQEGSVRLQKTLDSLGEFLPGVARYLGECVREFASNATPTLPVVLAVVSIIPAFMALRGIVSYLQQYCLNWVAVRVVADFRGRLLDHLLRLPLSFHNRTSTGELMSRLANDVGTLQGALAESLVALVKDPVALIAFVVFLLTQQPKLTLLSLAVFPICVVPIIIYTRKIRKSTIAIQNEAAQLFQDIHESLSGVRVVKAYNLETVVAEQYRRNIGRYIGQFMRIVRASELPGPLIEFFGMVGAAALLASVVRYGRGEITADAFMTFILAVSLMYARIRSTVKIFNRFVQARAASQRVFQLLETPSDLPEPVAPQPVEAAGKDIRFESVDFDYGDKPVLRGINLTVKAGQLVALVGASGSGKTTLTNLLLRFYDPKSGRILIGDRDLREVSSNDLRRQMAVVTQEIILFNETVRRNIELGRPGAGLEEVDRAAAHAHAKEFILARPEGYETMIGERGVNLSGGQRQRLALARAIIRDAPILILDEATSALDTESERLVQAALDELMVGRTTICVAHRLSTVVNADQIVVLAEGRIVETGRHDELLRRDGYYRRLYELQFKSTE